MRRKSWSEDNVGSASTHSTAGAATRNSLTSAGAGVGVVVSAAAISGCHDDVTCTASCNDTAMPIVDTTTVTANSSSSSSSSRAGQRCRPSCSGSSGGTSTDCCSDGLPVANGYVDSYAGVYLPSTLHSTDV